MFQVVKFSLFLVNNFKKMPLYKDFSEGDSKILIWKYEDSDVLIPDELLEAENLDKVKDYHPKKLTEMLMVRKMLQSLLPNHKILYKDNGEPFLEPSDFEISITHSFPCAALAISDKKIGIDLEKRKDKIKNIRHKFILHENQYIDNTDEVDFLTAIWCVKEALYKIHHSKHWSLKKHYEVMPFLLQPEFFVKSRVYDSDNEDFFEAKVSFFDEFCFARVSN